MPRKDQSHRRQPRKGWCPMAWNSSPKGQLLPQRFPLDSSSLLQLKAGTHGELSQCSWAPELTAPSAPGRPRQPVPRAWALRTADTESFPCSACCCHAVGLRRQGAPHSLTFLGCPCRRPAREHRSSKGPHPVPVAPEIDPEDALFLKSPGASVTRPAQHQSGPWGSTHTEV